MSATVITLLMGAAFGTIALLLLAGFYLAIGFVRVKQLRASVEELNREKATLYRQLALAPSAHDLEAMKIQRDEAETKYCDLVICREKSAIVNDIAARNI